MVWIDPLYLDHDPRVRTLVAKDRGFSEEDKKALRSIELELLNDFYACWCNLHSIPRDAMHRKKMEHAAQRLVDSARAVATYKKSKEPEKPRLEVVN